MMHIANIVTGIVAAALGMTLLIWVIPAQTVPAIFASVPSGFYPNVTSGMLVASGFALAVSGIATRTTSGASALPPGIWARFAAAFVLLFGAMYAIPLLGFLLAGMIICLITLLLMRENRWLLVAAICFAAPIVVWGGFELLLGRPLP